MSGEAILSDYERMEKKNRIRGDDNQKGKKITSTYRRLQEILIASSA